MASFGSSSSSSLPVIHPQHLPFKQYPWLVYPFGVEQMFYRLSHSHMPHMKSIPELDGVTTSLAHHSSGWLLLKGDSHCTLWNPTSSSAIKLPPVPYKLKQKLMCAVMSSQPGDPNFMALLFDNCNKTAIFIQQKSELKKWVEVHYSNIKIDGMGDENQKGTLIFLSCSNFKGNLYVYEVKSLYTITVDGDDSLKLRRVQCQQLKTELYCNRSKFFLAESRGELLCINILIEEGIVKNTLRPIQVLLFKLDFDRMHWITTTSDLDKHAIFINGTHAISHAATLENEIEGDSIYFIIPESDKESLYCFNIRDCRLRVNLPCLDSPPTENCPIFLMPRSNLRLSTEQKPHERKKGDNMTEREVATTPFCDLPEGPRELIFNLLNLFDYNNFRSISRHCLSAAPALKREHALSKLELSPWLLYPTDHMKVHSLVDPKHGCRFLMTIPETLVHTPLRFSKEGWLLMCDFGNLVSLYNPFTKAELQLPGQVPQGFSKSLVMGFSSLPTSPECMIVGIRSLLDNSQDLRMMYTIMGQGEWHEHGFNFGNNLKPGCLIVSGGAFYFLGEECVYKCRYDEEGENMIFNEYYPPAEVISYEQSYLVDWNGDVACVIVGANGKRVSVHRLHIEEDDEQHVWDDVESLGNDTFYVSLSSCLSTSGIEMGMQNRIYFPRVHENNVLYYSMETRRFHYDRQEGSMEDFHNTTEQLLAGWFDPATSNEFYV